MGAGNSIPTEVQLRVTGDAEVIARLNATAEASRRIKNAADEGSEGATRAFGGLEHAMGRLAGGNRELLMVFRGVSEAMEGTGDVAARLATTLAGGEALIAVVALVKGLESIADEGKRAFEDAGDGAHGFFENLAAGANLLEITQHRIESITSVTARLNQQFRDFKIANDREEHDIIAGPNAPHAVEDLKRKQEDLERKRDDRLGVINRRVDQRKEQIDSLDKIGFGELAAQFKTLHPEISRSKAMGMPVETIRELVRSALFEQNKTDISTAEKLTASTETQITGIQGQMEGAASSDRMQTAGNESRKQSRERDESMFKFWGDLQDKSTSGKAAHARDQAAEFILTSSWDSVRGVLKANKLPSNPSTPEEAYKLLDPVFKRYEKIQGESLKAEVEGERTGKLAGGSVAGSVEFYKEYAQNAANETAQQQLAELRLINQNLIANGQVKVPGMSGATEVWGN